MFDLQLFADEGLLSAEETTESTTGVLSSEDAEDSAGETENANEGNDKGEPAKDAENGAEGDSKEGEGEDKSPEGAPEKYETFKVPEGVTLDESAAQEFGDLARELNLSQDNAQKLVDYQVKFQQAQYAKLDAQNKKQSEQWAAETMKAYKKEELADARRGFKSAPKEVQEMLAVCGFDNHKAFVEFFAKVGKSLKEDTFETGKGKGGSNKTSASIIYPELN